MGETTRAVRSTVGLAALLGRLAAADFDDRPML